MATLRIPAATYRLQFNRQFTFRDARAVLGYFHELGITDVYASPLLQSRRGSGHGYDVTDPTRLDPELGTEEEFDGLQADLQALGMGLILDIVPNHMAADSENPFWMDVLENGPGSAYASYFDIDWHPPSRTLDNKVLLPVLGSFYGQTLENQELRLSFQDGRFLLRYYDSTFPLAPRSYRRILKHRLDALEKKVGPDSPTFQEYQGILASLAGLPERESLPTEAAGERRQQAEAIRARLRHLVETSSEVRKFLEENLEALNGTKNDPASFRPLDRILSEQPYVLAFWQNPNEGINYRRFFTITDLVGVRVEDPLVFEAIHGVILRLVERGAVTGLRVDHIDGLRDPLGYLRRLQERATPARASSDSKDFYVLVEKILLGQERLPANWPVYGTTGYDFLNAVNRLFVDPQGAPALEKVYTGFLRAQTKYEDLVYQKKKLVMNTLLAVEMRSLGRQMGLLAERDRYARDLARSDLAQALIEVTACLPVYRTYIRSLDLAGEDERYIEAAFRAARRRRPNLASSCFDFVREVLLLRDAEHLFPEQREERLAFVMRWQQVTGPIVAKGLEDTALYVYNPLISLNEVGGHPRPSVSSPEDLHRWMKERRRSWPSSLNATSTHDTKRAEDVRARVNVLSEIPQEWQRRLHRWARLNARKKVRVGGHAVPDANEEFFLYQTLLGAWPLDNQERAAFKERLQAYVVKATREAMVHTRWTRPNLEHERALTSFVEAILGHQAFLDDFLRFHRRVAYFGLLDGLAQVLLKIACPGVPDFYQGSELWDFRLVDPDNRGPVDFERHRMMLETLKAESREDPAAFAQDLAENWCDGRVKLYLIWKALNFRRLHPELFREGDYQPLTATSARSECVFAFCRRRREEWALVAVPRLLARYRIKPDSKSSGGWPLAGHLALPVRAPGRWMNILTGEAVACVPKRSALPLRSLFASFPVALLAGGKAAESA